jgi:hypothetical protein
MTFTNMLLIAACGILGFAIIWNLMGARGKD